MKKLLVILLSAVLMLTMSGCQEKEKTLTIGICQIAQHPALDAASEGFMKALKEEFGDQVTFLLENGSGDPATCSIICNNFVADNVDLILANATPALQAAASATSSIPILGTSVSDFGSALNIPDFKNVTGRNISGTSDLAPLDQQAQMIIDLLPQAKTVGLLFCSGEANSLFQVEAVKEYLESHGLTAKLFSFSSSADVSLVTSQACDECDALYIPTDNTAATCAELIGGIVLNTNTPVIAGEEALCRACGLATLTIDYYALGFQTGKMAAAILRGEASVSDMPIQFFDNPVFKFNKQLCEKFNITVPDGYVALD